MASLTDLKNADIMLVVMGAERIAIKTRVNIGTHTYMLFITMETRLIVYGRQVRWILKVGKMLKTPYAYAKKLAIKSTASREEGMWGSRYISWE